MLNLKQHKLMKEYIKAETKFRDMEAEQMICTSLERHSQEVDGDKALDKLSIWDDDEEF